MQPWKTVLDLSLLTSLIQLATSIRALPLDTANGLLLPQNKVDATKQKQVDLRVQNVASPLASDCSLILHSTSANCSAAKCTDDSDCNGGKDVCCFNGCVYTCVPRLPPPLVFDWEEDTDIMTHGELSATSPERVLITQDSVLESGVSTSHVLGPVGKGDCELTQEEYERVRVFQSNNSHVRQCFCENGQVLCQVATKGERKNSSSHKRSRQTS